MTNLDLDRIDRELAEGVMEAWTDDYAGQAAYFVKHSLWAPTNGFRSLLCLCKDWHPTRNSKQAFMCLKKITDNNPNMTVCMRNFIPLQNFGDPKPAIGNGWTVELMDWDRDEFEGEATEATLELAICFACLKAEGEGK